MLGTDSLKNRHRYGKFSDDDVEYMHSLAAAVVTRSPRYLVRVVALLFLSLVSFVVWLGWAEIDIVVRAQGKVIPSSQLQVIQSLEGGVISEILVKSGDQVEINQPLMKISDISFASSFEDNRLQYLQLQARITRLRAEGYGEEFLPDPKISQQAPDVFRSERSLFDSNKQQRNETIKILDEQVIQLNNEIIEAEAKERQLQKSLNLLKDEIALKKPLMQNRLISEVDFLQLRGRETQMAGELEAIRLSIPRIRSKRDEAKRKITQSDLDFQNSAKKELNEAIVESNRIAEAQAALVDRVERTTLRSPVKGTIKQVYITTVGGVIQPGEKIIEVVPREEDLIIEAKVKPSDIGDLSVGQLARIKFTAYDFAIYGSLEGTVDLISADTITNSDGESFYITRIVPSKQYLGRNEKQLRVKVGMVSEVDIITGKKTILQYLLKPIVRGLQNSLSES